MKKTIFLAILTALFLVGCASAPEGGEEKAAIKLRAKDATLQTTGNLVIENDGKNVGYWETTEDQIIWELNVEQKGEYMVMATYSCDPQFPGSEVAVDIDGTQLTFTTRDTGDWGNFTTEELGTISLEPGTYTVTVKALSVADRFVANLSTVRLYQQ